MTSRLEPMYDTSMGLGLQTPTLIDPGATDSKRLRFTASRAGVNVLPMVPTAAGRSGFAGSSEFSLPSAKTLMIGGAVVAGLLLLRRWA